MQQRAWIVPGGLRIGSLVLIDVTGVLWWENVVVFWF